MIRLLLAGALLAPFCLAQQIGAQDLDRILERADALLEEAKAAYESARDKANAAGFIDAGFKLEEARIKFLVLQEIGGPEKQKTAADRLRAVNQLTKLVHDGKVAVSSGAAVTEAPKPIEPAKTPDAAPPPPPPPPAVDVSKRAPVPDPDKQKTAEKQVRELFKEDYAKKAPADRKLLARALLEQAGKTKDEPDALWVLYREAQDIAAQAGDVGAALAAVDAAARLFDVDALLMKTATLATLAKVAKTPDDYLALAEAQIAVVDELVLIDQFDAADKTAAAALLAARKSNDDSLVARVMIRSKEVAEAKTLYAAQKRVLETLAKSPDDPGANLDMGKFLCYVKGVWDLGIRFLVKGSDPALKALAEKEIAASTASADRINLADGWFDLSEKEKSPLRKSQLVAHAKGIYESALPDAPALVRARVEKRLESLKQSAPPGGPVDLIRLLDPKRDGVSGDWSLAGKALSLEAGRYARLQLPYEPPDEYDFTVVAERKSGSDAFYVGLARGSSQFYVAIDDWLGTLCGIGWIDGKTTKDNETAAKGKFLSAGKATTIVCAVRKDGVTVTIDGKKATSYKGDYSRLTNADVLPIPNRRVVWVGANDSKFVITKLVLTPLSGPGKVVR